MDGESLFRRVRAEVNIKLLPSGIADVNSAVKARLTEMLMRLHSGLEGVPLAWANAKIRGETAEIWEDQPHVLLAVVSDFFLFSPRVGQKLKGVINNIAEDSVGLLILETFNATLSAEDLRSGGYEYDPNVGSWVNENSDSLDIGQTMSIFCKGIKSSDQVIQVIGVLSPEAAVSDDAPQTSAKSDKKKGRKSASADTEVPSKQSGEGKKGKEPDDGGKKRKRSEGNQDRGEEVEEVEKSTEKKKKQKKKKD